MNVSSFGIKVQRSLSASYVKLDTDVVVGVPITATFTNEMLRITIDVDEADGAAICRRYEVVRLDEGAGGLELATTDVFHGIPLRGLMAYALASSVVEVERTENGDLQVDIPADPGLAAVEAIIGSLKRTRRPMTDAKLKEFAEAYKAKFVPGHMRELAASMNYSERQGWRIKKRAEERGFLTKPERSSDGER